MWLCMARAMSLSAAACTAASGELLKAMVDLTWAVLCRRMAMWLCMARAMSLSAGPPTQVGCSTPPALLAQGLQPVA